MIGRPRNLWGILMFALLLPAAPARAQTGAAGASSGASRSTPIPAPTATQGNYSGSVPTDLVPGVLKLSLQEAMDRGLKQNLGILLSGQDVRTARGARWKELSALLPNLTTSSYVDASKTEPAEFGFSFPPSASFSIPSVIGPFAYFDSRAYVTQSILDLQAINNTHSASQSLKSAEYSFKDARDLVILTVGNTYLQAVADQARVETADAQVKTAQALYDQAADQVKAGTSPAIDALRANVELKTRQQDLIQSKNNFAIAKLTVARVIGLAPGQQFELTDTSLYEQFGGLTVDEALKRAYANRSDFQAALADVHAAEYGVKSAKDGYLPTLSFSADYGLAGTYDTLATHGLMDVRGTLNIPIFQGGRVRGDVLEASARLEQSRQRLDNLHAQIDDDVRTALLNIESAEEQVQVARSNIDLADETLAQSRDRFAAGVTDTVEVVQAEESVASAHESYIASLYADNYAKISLARALGAGEQGVKEFLKGN
ncbi:MAG: TolC family protein [Candidatus Acidiferrales bacterium]